MGRVCFVGAGPGGPGTLTLRGAHLLERAGAVAFEAGLDPRLLERIPAAAERVEVAPGTGAARVAEGLARAAAVHEVVVRLVRGGPLGFEAHAEAAALERAGVEVEMVPGVPVITASAELAGVPLAGAGTDRLVITVERGRAGPPTFVIEVPAGELEAAADELVARGCPEAAPALVVRGAGSPRQRTRSGPLRDVAAAAAREAGGDEPAVLIAGEAVGSHEALRWLEARPLFGWTVVVTRTREQAGDLVRLLEDRGATVWDSPLIRVEPPADGAPLRAAVRSLATFDWVVFTSANGVTRFWEALEREALDARAFGAARVACIGPGTAAALARRGVRPDLVPEAYVAEALLDALARAGGVSGACILLPRAASGRPVLPEGLRALGAEVVEVEAYRTVPETAGAAELRSWLAAGRIDALTFTSPSTVASFVDSVGVETGRALVAAIGPVTADAARALGLPVHIVATEHTMAGLVEALAARAAEERRAGQRV